MLIVLVTWPDAAIVALVSYGLLGIEQIGVEIEDPFEHTPNDIDLESIANTIEQDLIAYLGPASEAKTAPTTRKRERRPGQTSMDKLAFFD